MKGYCAVCGQLKPLRVGNDDRSFCTARCRKSVAWSEGIFPQEGALCNACGQSETVCKELGCAL